MLNAIMVPNETFMLHRKNPFLLIRWSFGSSKYSEFVINVPDVLELSVFARSETKHISYDVESAYFNLSASIENNAVSVYITRKQG